MLKAVKGNREYSIHEDEVDDFKDRGFNIVKVKKESTEDKPKEKPEDKPKEK